MTWNHLGLRQQPTHSFLLLVLFNYLLPVFAISSFNVQTEIPDYHHMHIGQSARSTPRYIFSFGDSITATSFNALWGPPPTPECPMGNPTENCLEGKTLAGGHNWITALTTVSNRTLTLTYNYADCGHAVDQELTPDRFGAKQLQLPLFLEGAGKEWKGFWDDDAEDVVGWTSQNSVFTFWFGVNDIGAGWNGGNDPFFIDKVCKSYFDMVETLYEHGARQFMFLSVPPMQRISSWSVWGQVVVDHLTAGVETMNSQILERAQEFQLKHRDVTIYHWDAYSTFNRILDNPSGYGFDNDLERLCNTDECFWWDPGHPSYAAYLIFAEEMAVVLEEGGFW